MSKYLWILITVGLVGSVFFGNFLTAAKNRLAAVISLAPFEKPQTITQNGRQVVVAKIYSTFPYNYRNLISLNAGLTSGVKSGTPVTVDGNILLGKVIETATDYSVVQTIFDKDFSLSVRVGSRQIEALLVGAQEPRLTLIDKTADIRENDAIYSASADFPYGMKIGSVAEIRDSAASSFKEASLRLDYQFNELKDVALLSDWHEKK
ncbi:MAG: hypothetical protein UY24_C0020G0006 [Parcubacteria group bacterium GW2011_GWA1_48_11b]|nr:MAG: hypothetical protein UY24_C0020G0006 [Parcubacteria group bacterium GW2011_GWA1_48_11b]